MRDDEYKTGDRVVKGCKAYIATSSNNGILEATDEHGSRAGLAVSEVHKCPPGFDGDSQSPLLGR